MPRLQLVHERVDHQPDLTNGYKRFPLPFSSCFHAVEEEESGNRERLQLVTVQEWLRQENRAPGHPQSPLPWPSTACFLFLTIGMRFQEEDGQGLQERDDSWWTILSCHSDYHT